MKKLLVLVLLFSFIVLTAQDKLSFNAFIDLGYNDQTMFLIDDYYTLIDDSYEQVYSQTDYFRHNLYSNVNMGLEWKNFTLSTNLYTYFVPVTFYRYSPQQSQYDIGLEYQFRNIVFHAEHLCSHSVDKIKYNTTYNRIGIRIHFFNK